MLRLQGASHVQVTAHIREEYAKRSISGLAVTVRGGTALVRPAAVRVVVTGPVALLRQLQPADVQPYVSLVEEGSSPQSLKVAAELASGFGAASVLEIEPAQVTVRPQTPRSHP